MLGNGLREQLDPKESAVAEVEEPILDVRNLSIALFSRGCDFPMVDRASFCLRKGEVLGLVGESGCGKSLTALALMRLLPPAARISGGSIRFLTAILQALANVI